MLVGLHDADNTGFPNIPLMKLSAAYKQAGHEVRVYSEEITFDKVVSSKVFTFTPEQDLPVSTVKGGTGYRSTTSLPESVEHICPDYSLYNCTESYGFLTRGCPNKCPWCFVPAKEGDIRAHADIEEFTRHRDVVLMDNNVLASRHGMDQIARATRLQLRIDFNQGLDARRISDVEARILSKALWLKPIRLACDSATQMPSIQKAVALLRWHNATPRRYFCYVLVKEDVQDALERVRFLKGLDLDPFCQPYIDEAGTEPTLEQRQLARWANTKMLFKTMTFDDYKESRNGRV
ncbi:hypothetical protein JT06_18915 [Desulfobulbus sp. Tol-SR]|nr:hypothetical protein JT06_18915 [Desulfobulbus sp. Tol-SR]